MKQSMINVGNWTTTDKKETRLCSEGWGAPQRTRKPPLRLTYEAGGQQLETRSFSENSSEYFNTRTSEFFSCFAILVGKSVRLDKNCWETEEECFMTETVSLDCLCEFYLCVWWDVNEWVQPFQKLRNKEKKVLHLVEILHSPCSQTRIWGVFMPGRHELEQEKLKKES